MAKTEKKKDAVVRQSDPEAKKKALDTAIAYIEKEYGAGTVMKLGQKNTMNVESIPTGSLTLDMALGIGGVPKGRITARYR